MHSIGILTRHFYPNYGSILQAYALQEAFRKIGADVSVLDYVRREDSPFHLAASTQRASDYRSQGALRLPYLAVQTPVFVAMGLVFRRFQQRLLRLTRPVSDRIAIEDLSAEFDSVVVGSDQVWNRIRGSLDEVYLLAYCADSTRRVSYAASFGASRPLEVDTPLVLSALMKFHSVSVREQTAVAWLESEGAHARNDIDPTLLHGRDFWDEFAGPAPKRRQYVLTYQLHHTPRFRDILRQVEKASGMPVVRLTPDLKHLVKPGQTKLLISPEKWVSWIRGAAFVVTDSFHCTAFALRFGIPLYVVPPPTYSERIFDLLRLGGLERLAVTERNRHISDVSPYYDADAVDASFAAWSVSSWQFISEIAHGGP